ncbi:MAG: hypothetical protein JST39_01400 [Bacteroidetes bacterium]|nr:hypothetical protein [Bacteroidota bacterium]
MDDRRAQNRYERIFNDGDAVRVIGTCLHIMHNFWKRYPDTHFVFYAVPRKWEDAILADKRAMSAAEQARFAERFKRTRFAIYNYAMLNLFPSEYFVHIRDTKNAIYILLNKSQWHHATRLKQLGKYLLANYNMVFEWETH